LKRFSLFLAATLLAACGGATPPPPTAPAASSDAGPPKAAAAASEEDALVPIMKDDATWGSRLAPVTIVAFEDFQCPFCSRAADTLAKVQAEYGEAKVRVVFKHFPLSFHPNARPAAEAAEGVRALGGSQAFWHFYTAAFAAQGDLGPEAYARWATASGVDAALIAKGSPAWAAKIDRDVELAQKIGVDSTPTFLVNGVGISGARPLDAFEEVVNDQLAKAKALAATGVTPEKVYATLTEANVKEQLELAKKQQAEAEKPDLTIYKVPVGKSPVLGDKAAKITIVEFSDFQCPYCKIAEDTLKQLRAKYGKDVRLVWKNEPLPFHPRAEPAAELALEARAEKGDDGFWAAHDALFASQPKLEDEDLFGIARTLGLDAAKVKAAIEKHKYAAEIDADSDLADAFKADGTPHFFVDGRRVAGAVPLEAFASLIEADLEKARGFAAQGVVASAMYDAFTKDGRGELEKSNVAPPPAGAPSQGPASAPVVVQEFADFQCPFCARAEPVLEEMKKTYGAKVRLVWRNYPLPETMHPDAELAAEAAMEANAQKGAEGFWKMHDLLFANQGTEGGLKRSALDGYAKKVGLDMARWAAALDGHTHKAEVDADRKAADDAKINGTPTFAINGYVVSGAQPFPKFKRVIDLALSEETPAKGPKRAAKSK
jgi:protein-disulfide isomerase